MPVIIVELINLRAKPRSSSMPLIFLLRKSVFRSGMLVLMTLQLINISINVADPSPVVEDLSINEIESCVELVVEVILGREDAISETNDHDHSTHRTTNLLQLFAGNFSLIAMQNDFSVASTKHESQYIFSCTSIDYPIVSPPPRI